MIAENKKTEQNQEAGRLMSVRGQLERLEQAFEAVQKSICFLEDQMTPVLSVRYPQPSPVDAPTDLEVCLVPLASRISILAANCEAEATNVADLASRIRL